MDIEIIMYHYIRNIKNSDYPGIKGLEYQDFVKQIEFLKHHYNFVSLKDIIFAFDGKVKLPDRPVLLTFDDGYADHYENVFPLLRSHEIPAVFSIPGKVLKERRVLDVNKIQFILACGDIYKIHQSLFERLDYYRGREFSIEDNKTLYEKYAKPRNYDNADIMFVKRILQSVLPEKLRNLITDELFKIYVTDDEEKFSDKLYMSFDQANEMKNAGMEFAVHGYDHYHFDTLLKDDYAPDIRKCLEVLEGLIDINEWTFCYPYGDYNDELISYCSGKGCIAGLTCDARSVNMRKDSIYKLPRYDTNDYPPRKEHPSSWG